MTPKSFLTYTHHRACTQVYDGTPEPRFHLLWIIFGIHFHVRVALRRQEVLHHSRDVANPFLLHSHQQVPLIHKHAVP